MKNIWIIAILLTIICSHAWATKLSVKIKDDEEGGGAKNCEQYDPSGIELKKKFSLILSDNENDIEVNMNDEIQLEIEIESPSTGILYSCIQTLFYSCNNILYYSCEDNTSICTNDTNGAISSTILFTPNDDDASVTLRVKVTNITMNSQTYTWKETVEICNGCNDTVIPLTLRSDLDNYSDYYVRASQTVTVDPGNGIFKVASNGQDNIDDVKLQAGENIILKSHFVVENGALFHAYIANCDDSENNGNGRMAGNTPVVGQPDKGETGLSAYPNPFRDDVRIRYILEEPGPARLVVANIQGQIVDIPTKSTWLEAGTHEVVWTTKNSQNGVYFARLITGNSTKVIRVIKQ